jgi:hypothetical protein
MLYTIYLHKVPGVIKAHHKGVTKQVHIRDGAIVHATSTDMNDSLGVFLRRTGRIDLEQFTDTMRKRMSSNRRHGEILIEEEVLSPEELYYAVREQTEAIVWSLFSWDEGQVTFTIGELPQAGNIQIHLPMRQVILKGIKQSPNAKALVARLGKKETIFEPSFDTEELIEVGLNRDEYRLLALVDGRRHLYALCNDGPKAPPENARLLYAFHVLKLIRRSGDSSQGAIKIRMQTDPAPS